MIRIEVVMVVTGVAASDETVVETMLIRTPTIVVMVIRARVSRIAPTMITRIVPAVIAVRIVPAPTIIKSAVIVAVRIVVRTVVVSRPVPVIAKIDTYAPVAGIVIIPIHVGVIWIVIAPAIINVAMETTNPRSVVVIVVIVVIIIIIVRDVRVACFGVIIRFRSRIIGGTGFFFRILLCNIFFGIVIAFRRSGFRPVRGRSGRILCIGGSAIDIIII